MAFPLAPVNGQQTILGNVTYEFNAGKSAWLRVPGLVGKITVDTFTGNGVQTSFVLTSSPQSVNNVFVSYDGAFVIRDSYSVTGSTLTFGSPPADGSAIEVTTFESILGANVSGSSTSSTASYGLATLFGSGY